MTGSGQDLKLPPGNLDKALCGLEFPTDSNLIVELDRTDDAGISFLIHRHPAGYIFSNKEIFILYILSAIVFFYQGPHNYLNFQFAISKRCM